MKITVVSTSLWLGNSSNLHDPAPVRSKSIDYRMNAGADAVATTGAPRAVELVTPVALMFFKPSVPHVGVHGMTTAGQTCDGCAWLLAGGHQFGLEFVGVGSVRGTGRESRSVWFFGHGVHELRAHDFARWERSVHDGFTGRLLFSRKFSVNSYQKQKLYSLDRLN